MAARGGQGKPEPAFAGYGFPKAHAASYAQVAWRSAWCKAHNPAVFMAGVVELISIQRVRAVMLYAVIAFAVLSHFGIATNAVTEETALKNFWRQVSWRVPALRSGTTLVIHSPLPGMGDGGYALMETANVIYFPEFTGEMPVHYPLSGLTLNSENLPGILDGTQVVESAYRSHTYTIDNSNVLVLSQPTLNSCVHIIYGAERG